MIKLKSITGDKEVEGRRIFNSDGTLTPYIVTEDGQIYSDEKKEYRKLDKPDSNGYIMVGLRINDEWKKFHVHKLVADHFLSNEFKYPCVNHKDCNPSNNDYHNLEHCTFEYNSKYAVIYGNSNYLKQQQRSKLSVEQIKKICWMIQKGYRNIDIANAFGVNKNYIANIKGRLCHTAISKDYDFGDNYKYWGDDLKGNEGNKYIPPLEDEPKYIRKDDPEFIRMLCKVMSGPYYMSSTRVGILYGISERTVTAIRNGKLFKEISKEFDINNDVNTAEKTYLDNLSDNDLRTIYKYFEEGKSVTMVYGITGITKRNLFILLKDEKYKSIRDEFNIPELNNRRGNKPLTLEEIKKVEKLLEETDYTREKIASIVGISLPSVVKIKRLWKLKKE